MDINDLPDPTTPKTCKKCKIWHDPVVVGTIVRCNNCVENCYERNYDPDGDDRCNVCLNSLNSPGGAVSKVEAGGETLYGGTTDYYRRSGGRNCDADKCIDGQGPTNPALPFNCYNCIEDCKILLFLH